MMMIIFCAINMRVSLEGTAAIAMCVRTYEGVDTYLYGRV